MLDSYKALVRTVLAKGNYVHKPSGVDSISHFGYFHSIDLSEGFPLLTTRRLPFSAICAEFLWLVSGQPHIRELQASTHIWDQWANADGVIESAAGRFWRNFPLPAATFPDEVWTDSTSPFVSKYGTQHSFDQLKYVIERLRSQPISNKHIITAWHPGNATIAKVPPCVHCIAFHLRGPRLNLHITQRSADVAVGVPFDIAVYSLLLLAVAQDIGVPPGLLAHSIVDAHIYCGTPKHLGSYYRDRLCELQAIMSAETSDDSIAAAADLAGSQIDENQRFDHVPALLKQIQRPSRTLPHVSIRHKPVFSLDLDDIQLADYTPHDPIKFDVVP